MHRRKVVKTELINQKKRNQLAILYGITPSDSYELQLGYTVELEASIAQRLVNANLAVYVNDGPTPTLMIDIASETPESAGGLTQL